MAPLKEAFLMLRIVIIFTLLLLAIPSVAANIDGKVVKVADGDTITILDSANQQHPIRLAGIDAPEKKQPFGQASKKRRTELVAAKEVRVEYEKYDRYGRIVGKEPTAVMGVHAVLQALITCHQSP